MPRLVARYNIAPSTDILAIREVGEEWHGSMMRWGLIPSWEKDPSSLPLLINARAETITQKQMFRHAFRRQRCIIPASGFYEWKAIPGQKAKQPFYISLSDDAPMSFAGLWEEAIMPDGEVLDTCIIITTLANATLSAIHDRMPVILERDAWDDWLDPASSQDDQLRSLLKPAGTDRIRFWPVSTAVNRVANDGPTLLEPLRS